jgi:hypothetical protein
MLAALRTEAAFQSGTAAALSPAFENVVAELRATVRGSPGYSAAIQILQFLKAWSVPCGDGPGADQDRGPVDANKILAAFRQHFLPHIVEAELNYAQLDRNFDYVYRRRNTLLTFIFAIAVVIAIDVPIGTVYRQARGMTSEQALALAERARAAYDSLVRLPAARAEDSVRAREYLDLSRDMMVALRRSATLGPGAVATEPGFVSARIGRLQQQIRDGGIWWTGGYLLECLVTALLVAFGAPFWNDLAGVLIRASKGSSRVELAPARPGPEP